MSEFPQRVRLQRADTEKPYTWDYHLVFQYPDGSERKFFMIRIAYGSFRIEKYEFHQRGEQKIVSLYIDGNAAGQEYTKWEHYDLSNGECIRDFKSPSESGK